jgi:hypothetical protein
VTHQHLQLQKTCYSSAAAARSLQQACFLLLQPLPPLQLLHRVEQPQACAPIVVGRVGCCCQLCSCPTAGACPACEQLQNYCHQNLLLLMMKALLCWLLHHQMQQKCCLTATYPSSPCSPTSSAAAAAAPAAALPSSLAPSGW